MPVVSSSTRSLWRFYSFGRRDFMVVSETTNAAVDPHARARAYLATRHHWRWAEALPWLIALAAYFIFPDRMTFGTQVLVMVLFALSLDLILGYAGIVTLGQAA